MSDLADAATAAPDALPAREPPPAKEPEAFSREYVAELRNENKGWRLKAQEHEGRAKAAEAAAEQARAEADQRAAKAEEAAAQRIIHAELRAAALAAGMRDLDGLKLADVSQLRLNQNAEVEGVDQMIADLKAAKPYLFEARAASTSHTATRPPSPTPPARKRAAEMTEAEFDAALARIDAGRGPPT
jgi:hypothetical protein